MCDVCLSFYLIILTVHTNTAQQTRLPAGWPTDKVVTMKTVTTVYRGPTVHRLTASTETGWERSQTNLAEILTTTQSSGMHNRCFNRKVLI